VRYVLAAAAIGTMAVIAYRYLAWLRIEPTLIEQKRKAFKDLPKAYRQRFP
jgi:hypothetical protein